MDLQRVKGEYTFSQTHVQARSGSRLHIRFPDDETFPIFQSAMPPCASNVSITEHLVDEEAIKVDGRQSIVIEMAETTITYFFVQSMFHTQCSAVCCLTLTINDNLSLSNAVQPSGYISPAPISSTGQISNSWQRIGPHATGSITQMPNSVRSDSPTSSGGHHYTSPLLPSVISKAGQDSRSYILWSIATTSMSWLAVWIVDYV